MKKNKFRAWDSSGLYNGTPGMLEDLSKLDNGKEIWNDQNYIKMQYIGVEDSKGNEIYEGDIIKGISQMYIPNWDGYSLNSDESGFVDLDEEEIGIVVHQTKGLKSEFVILSLQGNKCFSFDEISSIEVVGTVYTNPELLNGQAVASLKQHIAI